MKESMAEIRIQAYTTAQDLIHYDQHPLTSIRYTLYDQKGLALNSFVLHLKYTSSFLTKLKQKLNNSSQSEIIKQLSIKFEAYHFPYDDQTYVKPLFLDELNLDNVSLSESDWAINKREHIKREHIYSKTQEMIESLNKNREKLIEKAFDNKSAIDFVKNISKGYYLKEIKILDTNNKLNFKLVSQPEGGFTVTCKEIPELVTECESFDDFIKNTEDVLQILKINIS